MSNKANEIPIHVAIIMDGNGRWAQKNGQPRIFGHNSGVGAVRLATEAAAEIGVKYLTLYTFSTENWNRPDDEVAAIMSLLINTIEGETPTLSKNNVRLQAIGDMSRLPAEAAAKLEKCIADTAANTGLTLILALSYSSRWEIAEMARKISEQTLAGSLKPGDISEDTVSKLLCTAGVPDPELLIRTSGEYRISNFLLWQIAYTELYFTDKLWPDFTKEDFFAAIADYQKRQRRFGKTAEQMTK